MLVPDREISSMAKSMTISFMISPSLKQSSSARLPALICSVSCSCATAHMLADRWAKLSGMRRMVTPTSLAVIR